MTLDVKKRIEKKKEKMQEDSTVCGWVIYLRHCELQANKSRVLGCDVKKTGFESFFFFLEICGFTLIYT